MPSIEAAWHTGVLLRLENSTAYPLKQSRCDLDERFGLTLGIQVTVIPGGLDVPNQGSNGITMGLPQEGMQKIRSDGQ